MYATRLLEIEELQNYFDAPTQEVLDEMEREYIFNKNKCLKEEMEHVRFIIGCVSLQRYYRSMFSKYLYINNKSVENNAIDESLINNGPTEGAEQEARVN